MHEMQSLPIIGMTVNTKTELGDAWMKYEIRQ